MKKVGTEIQQFACATVCGGRKDNGGEVGRGDVSRQHGVGGARLTCLKPGTTLPLLILLVKQVGMSSGV